MITDKQIQAELKQKVALYKYSTDDGSYSWVGVSQYREDKKEVRLSEPLEIEFTLRTDSDILSEEVISLEKQIDKIKEDALYKIEQLNGRIQELKAITWKPEGNEND